MSYISLVLSEYLLEKVNLRSFIYQLFPKQVLIYKMFTVIGLPLWLSSKESACSAGDVDLIPESGRSLRERYSNPLQYSCLENTIDRRDWRATAHTVAKNQSQWKRLSMHTEFLIKDENALLIDFLMRK